MGLESELARCDWEIAEHIGLLRAGETDKDPPGGGILLGLHDWYREKEIVMAEFTEHVNHPAHYGGDSVYEVIKVIEAWELGFHLGNTVKYVARAGKKDAATELEDLRKARWYLNRMISQLEAGKPGLIS